MKALTYHSSSESQTQCLGAAIARCMLPGAIIGLDGNLGAGKTRLVAAIAVELGVDRRVISSPTFVLVHEYEGRLSVFHFDAYRLADSDEFLAIGAMELLEGDGVSLIEWAERVDDVLPADRISIAVQHTGPTDREFRISAGGRRSQDAIDQLAADVPELQAE